MKTHYDTLGVKPGASQQEIRSAYRRKAREAHPDRQGGDAERMAEINLAYHVLGHDGSREEYDRTGKSAPAGSVESRAVGGLAKLLGEMIDKLPEDMDLIEHARNVMKKNIEEFEEKATVLQRKIRRIRKDQKRLKRKGPGLDIVGAVLADKVRGCEAQLANMKDTLEQAKVALAILADYEVEMRKGATATTTLFWASAGGGF